MARGKIRMHKLRELIRLHEKAQLSCRQISGALGISKSAVNNYLQWYSGSGLTYQEIVALSDDELQETLEKTTGEKSTRQSILIDYLNTHGNDLKKTGVTRRVLWEEYLTEHPDGYLYTQFCHHLKEWCQATAISFHREHKAGDRMYVDFTGKKLLLTDRETGTQRPVEIFVALLGASQLTYAEAVDSQKKGDWIRANEAAFRYFGGSTAAIVPDCLKSAVTKADRYEPEINPDYADFARHYSTVILPARPLCPQDKSLVENIVKTLYSRVFAPLRNESFFTLEELNSRIKEIGRASCRERV